MNLDDKSKVIPLSILIVVILGIISGSYQYPLLVVAGIITTLMNPESNKKIIVNILISFIIGAIIVGILNLVYAYYGLNPFQAIAYVSYALLNIPMYIIFGLLGGLIGYNINTVDEDK